MPGHGGQTVPPNLATGGDQWRHSQPGTPASPNPATNQNTMAGTGEQPERLLLETTASSTSQSMPRPTAETPVGPRSDAGWDGRQPSPFQFGAPATPPPGGNRRRWSQIVLPLAIVVVALGVSGAVFFLPSGAGTTHKGSQNTTVSARPSTSTTHTHTTSSTTSTTVPSPSGPLQMTIQPAAEASTVVTPVADALEQYLGGIQARQWNSAYAALSPTMQAKMVSPAVLASGDKTSVLSHLVIHSITPNSNGAAAVVSFTTHQAPNAGPNPGETCTNWSLSYSFIPAPSGTGYVIDAVSSVGPGHVPCGG